MTRFTLRMLILGWALLELGVLRAQQWTLGPGELPDPLQLDQILPVDGGSSAIAVGWTHIPEDSHKTDGVVVKVGRGGECVHRTMHVPGMWLAYKCATQLDNGNCAVFGICEDSLSDMNDYGHYLRVDILDTLLQPVSSRLYRVNDTLFGVFSYPISHSAMRTILTEDGTVVLVTSQSRRTSPSLPVLENCLCFYEIDTLGDTLRAKAPMEGTHACVGSDIKSVTRSPDSCNTQVFLGCGAFPGGTVPGFKTVDDDFEIVGSQALHKLPGAQWMTEIVHDVRSEGRWDSDGHMVVCAEMTYADRQRPTIYHQTLYRIDTLGHNLGEVRLQPVDSCMYAPNPWNTAYADDTTMYVLTYCGTAWWSMETQVNVTLVDSDMNVLGRKVLRPKHAGYVCGQPAVFDDGGCVFPLYNTDYNYGSERMITQTSLVKIARDDIEITWDVVSDKDLETRTGAYPNPARDVLHIPLGGKGLGHARLRIVDASGAAVVDAPLKAVGDAVTVNVGNLDPGMYAYQVVTDDKTVAKGKFVKE